MTEVLKEGLKELEMVNLLWEWFKDQNICLFSDYGIKTIEDKGLIEKAIQIPKSWANYAINDLKDKYPEINIDTISNIVNKYVIEQ